MPSMLKMENTIYKESGVNERNSNKSNGSLTEPSFRDILNGTPLFIFVLHRGQDSAKKSNVGTNFSE
jgi:hypothetical protein